MQKIVTENSTVPQVTSLCVVGSNAIWCGDSEGYVSGYSRDNFALLFNYKMEPDSEGSEDGGLAVGQGVPPASPVRDIHFVSELRRVCVAMHNGRMFLCDADVVPSGPVGGEGRTQPPQCGTQSNQS